MQAELVLTGARQVGKINILKGCTTIYYPEIKKGQNQQE